MREFLVNRALIDESTIGCKDFWKNALWAGQSALLFVSCFLYFFYYYILHDLFNIHLLKKF